MENSVQGTCEEKQRFLLFVSGMSHNSVHAIENMKLICEKYLPDRVELQIIDVNREYKMALKYQIIAIPTLIRINPEPSRVIIGDLSETDKVLRILDLKA
jgi:circadian clock protein KaiB